MSTTNFYHSDGSYSSTRSSSSGFESTSYVGSMCGGSTFNTGNVSSRISNDGSYLGSSVQLGGRTTYFSSTGHSSSHLASYR